MKKFLSLLLAMTMVMSLIVLPARASEGQDKLTMPSQTLTTTRGDSTGINITATAPTEDSGYSALDGNPGYTAGDHPTWSWTASPAASVELTNANQAEVTVKGKVAGQVTLTCNYSNTWSKSEAADVIVRATGSVTITGTDAILASDIKTVTFKGRPASINSAGKVVYYTIGDETAQVSDFAFTSDSYSNIQVSGTVDSLTLTSGAVTGTLQTEKKSASVTLSNPTNPTISKNTTGCGTTSITATCNGFTAQGYTWYDGETAIDGANSATLNWTPATTAADGAHTIKCVVKYGDADNQKIESATTTVTIESKTYDIRPTASTTSVALGYVVASNNQSTSFPSIKLYDVTNATVPTEANPAATFTYSEVSDPSNAVSVNPSTGAITVTGSGTATLRATTSYKGKTYSKDLIVYASALMADFDRQAWYNSPATYYYSDLVTAATKALSTGNTYGSNYYYGTVNTIQTVIVNNNSLGTSTNTLSYGAQSGSITFTPYYNARGKAPVTVTLTTTTGKPVTVTLNIPVVPIPRTFDSLTAEPVTTNYTTSINNYRITFPSTYSTYYVVQKNGTTAPDYATVSLGNPYSAGSQYTLSSADFGTNGTCTLYVIATNNYTYGSSYGMYYSGAITVSQTNYNINYNGVAGETVQFKHADFTNFMNEVSQARGDASKTGSYPYVTFNYVTFNYPTSTQGTLYYNGTAMSNSSYSGSFNSRTQITNLDNVTFVPYARTSAKSIPLTFTLSVTKYGANGAVVNRDLKYTGTVVVSIVREDIKYTAAPGDTIRFTDSDFLNYLRTQNGFNSNYYSIDYVTFDQSAVNALNEGVLYAYSTGFNAVKTTDKFYYTTTSYNQNALSDVTFRASAYAKTGTTVYIPFTIYARYGTTGTGTRQVSGTVAIKLAQTMNFVDVKPIDYFYDSVKWAVNSNITKGTSATTFSPYKTCTRAEIVTFLWRAAGSKIPTITRNPFTDVAPSMGMDYYYAILWASQNGIAAGTSATTFSPNATCTRAQIVTFLWRYSNKPAGYYSNPFTDVNKAEHAAYYDAILWAVGKGITKGTTATTFSPYGTCTRGEAVTFLYRAVNGK